MRKLAGFLIVLVLGLVGLSIAAHVFVDQDALRQRLVQALRRQTGLSMRVARSSIQILPWPSFEATDVVLTHPGDAPLLQAHTLHAGISVFALLHREVRFQDFVIEHATLDLVRDASGRANWTLTPEHEADSTSGPARTGQRIDARWDVSLDGMRVNGAKLLWNDAVGGMSGAFEIDSLDLAGLRSASPWVDLKARHSGTPFTLKGHLGALTQGAVTQPWAFSVGATLGVGPKQDHVDLDGRVADPARLAGIMLTAQGEMSNLRDLQLLFPHASLPDVPALGGNIILGGSVGPFEALRGEGAFGHLRDGLTPVTVHLHAGSIPFRQGLVRNVVLDAAGKDAPVLLTGDAAWRQSAWRVQLGAATLGQAMAAWRDGLKSSVQVNLELRSEDKLFTGSPSINAGDAAHMTLEGTIGGVPSAGVGHLELQGTARTLHLPGAVLHDTVLHGMADGQAENGVALKGLSFASKELTLDAALTLVSSSDAPPLLDGNLHVARADFDVLKGLWLSSAPPSHPLGDPVSADTHVTSGSVGPVAPEAGPQIGSPGHPTVSPSATHPGTPVSAIPDWVQRLRAQDVNLHFSADHILYDGRDYTQLATHLTLSGGHLRLDPISGQAQGVALSGMAELDAGTLPATATVTFEPLVLPAGLLQKQLGLPVLLQGPMQLVGQVSGRGVTLNDLRQSLGGHLGLSVVDGQIESAALRQLAGPAAGVLPNSGTQRLRCLGVHMMLSDDVAHLDTLGFQAGRLSATGHGTVILGTRDLNLHLVPALDFGGAGASTPVSVTGTPDALHVAQDRDARGNFHLTLGGGAPTDPCAAALAAAREGSPGADPAPLSQHHSRAGDFLRALGVLH